MGSDITDPGHPDNGGESAADCLALGHDAQMLVRESHFRQGDEETAVQYQERCSSLALEHLWNSQSGRFQQELPDDVATDEDSPDDQVYPRLTRSSG